jgi:formylglycine-generating enzyme
MRLLGSFVLITLLGGCPGEVPPDDDAGPVDASIDVISSDPDAGSNTADAMGPMADAGIACTVTTGNRQGTCMPTASCAGLGGHESVPGFCPGAADIQCCVTVITASQGTCDPTDHSSPNEGLSEAPGEGGCPAGMVRIPAATPYCIDKYEASLVTSTGASWSPFFNPGTTWVKAVSIEGAIPQGYMRGVQAETACGNAMKRLCSATEWTRACKGSAGTTYPYGNTREWDRCNDRRARHPAVELFGSVTNLGSPCINQLDDSAHPAGTDVGCVSEDGPHDMMGNLHEWIADSAGTFRGGFYVDTVINGNGCNYATTAHDFTGHYDYSIGFRCCKSL